jgi:hypothetical protein
MDILVIDLTNRCFLRCSNCTRDIVHQTLTREMTPDTFRAALASVREWWRPGRVIGLIGGEPTLNKHFEEICRIFREAFNPGATTHGRQPIRDFNSYAIERLFDRTNGKGLWTSFGPRFMDYYEIISDTFSHWNPNDHSTGQGVHQTSLVDAREMCAAIGIDWSQWPALRDACWLQNRWSAAITPAGKAYFCERAAQLDALYNEGELGWDVEAEPEWWKRTPAQFGDQLSICEMCSMALAGPGQVDKLERDIIGQRHLERLTQLGSPAIKRGQYEAFDPAIHIQRRQINRHDNYVGPSGVRVAQDNKFVYGKFASCVVVCVGRAEHLALTLPNNLQQVDELIVVTTSTDTATQEVVRSCQGAKLVISDRCFADHHAFNKGRMINDGLRATARKDWVILTDADIYLNQGLRQWTQQHVLNPGVLYGTQRLHLSPNALPQSANAFIEPKATGLNAQPDGYFQLFNRRALAIRDRGPAVMSEAFCSAGSVDSWFLIRFSRQKQCVVPELIVAHIDHGDSIAANWNASPRTGHPVWRQFGFITGQGFFSIEDPPPVPVHVRLVDTADARVWEGQLGVDRRPPADVVRTDENGNLIYLGKPLDIGHVHVAWFDGGQLAHAPRLVIGPIPSVTV